VLPLHHTHGIVNCLLGPLAVGGRIKMLENFAANLVWENLLSEEKDESRY
jgi:malonyl-CoA/methylmalonyl-CoA synthetase